MLPPIILASQSPRRRELLAKAGSYAFQEHGEMIISSVRGDTDNVIGLPVREVVECLRSLGY